MFSCEFVFNSGSPAKVQAKFSEEKSTRWGKLNVCHNNQQNDKGD
jgi:hypothetical protein